MAFGPDTLPPVFEFVDVRRVAGLAGPFCCHLNGGGEELKQRTGQGLGGIAYLFITLLISPVTMFLMAGEVEQLYRAQGKEPPITTIWGLWFLLPVIGNFIWFFRIQGALNDYWTSNGSTHKPGL